MDASVSHGSSHESQPLEVLLYLLACTVLTGMIRFAIGLVIDALCGYRHSKLRA